jgi:hypothetical protein
MTKESLLHGRRGGARKDVERAFGVFQFKFKAVANPIHIFDPKKIGVMVRAFLIPHNNMDVSDRVMGDVDRRYDPGSVEQEEEEVPITEDDCVVVDGDDGHEEVDNNLPAPVVFIAPPIVVSPPVVAPLLRDFDRELAMGITIQNETRALVANEVESYRLQRAPLIDYIFSWKTNQQDDGGCWDNHGE